MNWPLFLALAITFGFVSGNVMLVKHSAKLKRHQKPVRCRAFATASKTNSGKNGAD